MCHVMRKTLKKSRGTTSMANRPRKEINMERLTKYNNLVNGHLKIVSTSCACHAT